MSSAKQVAQNGHTEAVPGMDGRGSGLRPIQEGSSLLIRGFPSGPRPYEEVLTFLRKGNMLQKYGRHGNPKYHHFRLGADDLELQWESKGGRIRRVPLAWMRKFQRGQETDVFRRYPQPSRAFQSFSIIYTHQETSKERSLDVICPSYADFEVWYWGLQVVRAYPPSQFSALLGPRGAPMDVGPRSIGRQAASALEVSRSVDTVSSSTTGKTGMQRVNSFNNNTNTPVASVDRSLPQAPRVPSPRELVGRNIGDLYVWGSMVMFDDADSIALPPGMPRLRVDAMAGWQQGRSPMLVHNTGGLNVVHASCGTRHAALISRAGELYTWGYGRSGALGHGSVFNLFAPQRVEGRWVQAHDAVHSAAASDTITAAVTGEGKLYTWGAGLAGQLGHGPDIQVATAPKLVRGLMTNGLRVLSVSCGPHHTAATTSSGLLYTWGCGLFGKLGHGDQQACHSPRPVAGLEGLVVTGVSCGWWHTAAVASARGPAPPQRRATNALTGGQPQLFGMQSGDQGAAARGMTSHEGAASAAGGANSSMSTQDLDMGALRQELRESAGGGLRVGSDTDAGRASASLSVSEAGVPGSNRMLPTGAEAAGLSYSTERWMEMVKTGGMLFTWGGDFTWMEPADVRSLRCPSLGTMSSGTLMASAAALLSAGVGEVAPPEGRLSNGGAAKDPTLGESGSATFTIKASLDDAVLKSSKRDHHRGSLGTGDLQGRLIPHRVGGELELRDVVQVGCGWNLTVAVTREGHVFQMGATGAYNAEEGGGRGPPWEGCRLPTQVDGALFGLFVDEVAVGMHHVAAVASRLQANGRLAPEHRRSRLLTWGRGKGGQLGTGTNRDHNLPQVVASIDGRRILHVACGGQHTLAVCEHDLRDGRRPRQPSFTQYSFPSPPASVINGLAGLGPPISVTPSVASTNLLAPPRSSYPLAPPRGTPQPSMQRPPVVPVANSGSGLAGIAAAIVTAAPSANNVTSTVSNWLGTLTGLSSSTSGAAAHGASRLASGPPPANPASEGRGSVDTRLRRLRPTQSTGFRVVQLPTMMRRTPQQRASDGISDAELRQGRARTTSRPGQPPLAATMSQNGPLAALARMGTASINRMKRRLTSNASSGALSTHSSPGVVEAEDLAASERLSPTGSILEYDTAMSAPGMTDGPVARAVSDLPVYNRRPDEFSLAGQESGRGSAPGGSGASYHHRHPITLTGMSTGSTHTSLDATPLLSPSSAMELRQSSMPDFPTLPEPRSSAPDDSAGAGHTWCVSLPPYQPNAPLPTIPDTDAATVAGSSLVGQDGDGSGLASSEPEQYPPHAARDTPFVSWRSNAAAPVHVRRYGPEVDDAPGSPASGTGVAPAGGAQLITDRTPERGPHHSLIGRPLGLIREQSSGELQGVANDGSGAAGDFSLQKTFELTLRPTPSVELPPNSGAHGPQVTPHGPPASGAELTHPFHRPSWSPDRLPAGGMHPYHPPPLHIPAGVSLGPLTSQLKHRASDVPRDPAGVHGGVPTPSFVTAPQLPLPGLLPDPSQSPGQPPADLAAQNAALQRQVAALMAEVEALRGQGPGTMASYGVGSPTQPRQVSLQSLTRSTLHRTSVGPLGSSTPTVPAAAGGSAGTPQHAGSPASLVGRFTGSPGQPSSSDRPRSEAHAWGGVGDHGGVPMPLSVRAQRDFTAPASVGSTGGPSIISIGARRGLQLPEPDAGLHGEPTPHGPRTVGGVPLPVMLLDAHNNLRAGTGRPSHDSAEGPGQEPMNVVLEEDQEGCDVDEEDHTSNTALAGVEGGDGVGEPGAPIMQLQHPFASAVSVSPELQSEDMGSGSSALASVAGVVQAVGPAMLRTKAASILNNARSRHRRAQSVDVSRLSLAHSPTHSGGAVGVGGLPRPGVGGLMPAAVTSTPRDSLGMSGGSSAVSPHAGAAPTSGTLPAVHTPLNRLAAQQASAALAALGTGAPGGVAGQGGGEALVLEASQGSGGYGGAPAEHLVSLKPHHSMPYRRAAPPGSRAVSGAAVAPAAAGEQGGGEGDAMGGPDGRANLVQPLVNYFEATQQLVAGQRISAAGQQGSGGAAGPVARPDGQQPDGSWVDELWPGVYVFLRLTPGSAVPEVWKIRFSRRLFNAEQAAGWWAANQALLAERFTLNLQFHPGGLDEPGLGGDGGSAGSGSGNVAVSSAVPRFSISSGGGGLDAAAGALPRRGSAGAAATTGPAGVGVVSHPLPLSPPDRITLSGGGTGASAWSPEASSPLQPSSRTHTPPPAQSSLQGGESFSAPPLAVDVLEGLARMWPGQQGGSAGAASGAVVSVLGRARPGHMRSRSGGPSVGGRPIP